MVAMTWYDWFKAGHVIVAVLWVGGGATLALMALMTLRMHDPIRVAQFAHQAGKIGERLYTPASLLVLLFGIGLMTNDQSPWDWDLLWVQIALAGWALTFLVGFFWIGLRRRSSRRRSRRKAPRTRRRSRSSSASSS